MKAHVLLGSKQEIAENLVRLSGEVREAIVFVEEPAPTASESPAITANDIFLEMRPFMVNGASFDDSREAIYSRRDSE